MTPSPVVLGLNLCERVIIEKGTENPSLIGLFNRMRVAVLPGTAMPFSVFTTLTGTNGSGMLEMQVENLRTLETVQVYRQAVHFPNPLSELRLVFRLNECPLPEAGWYQLKLLADGDWIAQRRFEVVARST